MRLTIPAITLLAFLASGSLLISDIFKSQKVDDNAGLDRISALQINASVKKKNSEVPSLRTDRTKPMYLLLTVEGLQYCKEGENHPEVIDNSMLESYCQRNNFDNTSRLNQLMEQLEPGGPAGKIQVGYVITTKLLSLFKATDSGWIFDAQNFSRELRLIEKLDRPVALYLSSTHFDTLGPLPKILSQKAENLAVFPDLQAKTLSYFNYPIFPYTLNPSQDIAVNRYKREAFSRIHEMIQNMDPRDQRKIVAIFLGGETHQFYEGFEDGMGQFEKPVVTDYSPSAKIEFQQWLQQKYQSIEALNTAYGTNYSNFSFIEIPSGNFRNDRKINVLNHYDGYSQGTVAVHGWYYDPQDMTDAIRIYVDGEYVGDAQMGLNRLDVYRAVDDILTPSTGFRMNLPFDNLPSGKHMVSVTYVQGNYECFMDERIIEVLGRQDNYFDFADKHRVSKSIKNVSSACPPQIKTDKRFYLDSPKYGLQLGFNPLSEDWNQFREKQVTDYMYAVYEWANDIGYDKNLIFSHQIVPQANSSWNENLFATGTSIASNLPWKSGFNLYGGSVWSNWTEKFLQSLNFSESGYGIPEFHPQQWKDKKEVFRAVANHYNAGAHFISPYYFSIVPEKYLQDPSSNAVSRMRLEPENNHDGSNLFYDAILHFSKE